MMMMMMMVSNEGGWGKPSEISYHPGCGFCFPFLTKVLWNSAEERSFSDRGPRIYHLAMASLPYVKLEAPE